MILILLAWLGVFILAGLIIGMILGPVLRRIREENEKLDKQPKTYIDGKERKEEEKRSRRN